MRVSSGVVRAGQIALAIALMAALWQLAGGQDAARALASANPLWLGAAVTALTAQTVLSALRWRLTAAQLGIALSRRDALREYYLSQAVNLSLPGGVIGDAGRAVRSRGGAGLLAASQAVVLERLAGQAGLFAVTVTTFAVTLARPGGVDWPAWLIGPVALFALAGLCLPGAVFLLTRMPGHLGQAVAGFVHAARVSLVARGVIGPQIGLSLGTTLCNLAAFAFCAQAVGHGLSPVAVAAFVPLILLTMLVPLTISGWGLREGAAAVLFPLAGSTASGGLATSVAFGLMMLVAALPGSAVLLVQRRGPVGVP